MEYAPKESTPTQGEPGSCRGVPMSGTPTLQPGKSRFPLTWRLGMLAVCLLPLPRSAQAQTLPRTIASVHMPQGAFLRKPSPDMAHLVQQVQSDPTVALRYARLFHLPVKMVPLALAQLRLKSLSTDHVLEVHFVKAGEKLVFKLRRVRQGTPVYCLPDGTPLLLRVCGNPIRTRVSPATASAWRVPTFDAAERLIPQPPADSSTLVLAPPVRSLGMPPVAAVEPVTPVGTALPLEALPAEDVLPPHSLPLAPARLSPPALKAASLPPVYAWVHSTRGGGERLRWPCWVCLVFAAGRKGACRSFHRALAAHRKVPTVRRLCLCLCLGEK